MKLSQLWQYCTKKKEVEKPDTTQATNTKTVGKTRIRWVLDNFGNYRQVIRVKCPNKIAKRITVLAREMRGLA